MKSIAALVAISLLLFAPLRTEAAAVVAVELKPDRPITYKTVDGIELKLHVFEPAGRQAADRRPAIVFFFGGGWSSGDPKQFFPQARALANLGMVAFSADYRVKSRHQTTPFACVRDGKSAIRWVREHAAEWGIDPDRIVAAGGSAGGHVAACTALITGGDEAGENTKISSAPNALVLFNPVLDTTEQGYGAANFKPEQQTELSPVHHVRRGVGPTIIFHGTADTTVPFENAERFTRLMSAEGNLCVLVPFAGKGHGFFNAKAFRPSSDGVDYESTLQGTIKFLTAHGFIRAKH